ncbi:MAG: arsenite methyltransferase [Armatimonadota bacterium]
MDDIKRQVQENYGAVARAGGCGCGGGPDTAVDPKAVGYAAEDLAAAPEGSNMGLGCGNPLALADLKPGETVLDLGSGGGFDCFLAANAVGHEGHVIGVDMTEDMIALAKRNAAKGGFANVEFRLGDIETLPVEDAEVDVILSNCVINLVPDKQKAFAQAFRVLKPGGRLHVSDIVLTCDELPEVLLDVQAYVNCIAGAVTRADYLQAMQEAGFVDVQVHSETDAALLLGSGCCTPPAEEVAESCCCGTEADEEESCCCGAEQDGPACRIGESPEAGCCGQSAEDGCCEEPAEACGCGASLVELPAGLVVSMTVSANKPL